MEIESEKAEIKNSKETIVSEIEKQYEAVSGDKKSDSTYNMQKNIIEQFLDKCNEKDIQGAYDLLSDDCKQTLYPSINSFIDGYYNKNFNEKKTYSYQLWSNNTYQIKIRQDILSTGVYSDSAYIEDYYTLVGNKLNINGYVKKFDINKEIQQYDIKINIVDMDFYRDYTICNIQVTNNTTQEILLDSREQENTIFLIDKKDNKYNSYINEINESQLRVLKGENKNISIKFNYIYKGEFNISDISFNNIIINYDKYTTEDIQKDVKKIVIEI